jgi:hypothetical protein
VIPGDHNIRAAKVRGIEEKKKGGRLKSAPNLKNNPIF